MLIFAVKSQDTIAALDPWPRHLPVVCAQNGVAIERMALRRFERVYGMCVWLPASHLDPGTVRAYGAPMSGMLQVACLIWLITRLLVPVDVLAYASTTRASTFPAGLARRAYRVSTSPHSP